MHEFLRQVPIFAELGDEELRLLAEAAVEQHFQQSSTIIHKDKPGTSLFIVRSGVVHASTESPQGHAINLATFGAGEFFGEMALFDGKPRAATVIAQEDTTLIEISRESFIKLAFRHTDVALRIMAEIASRVRQTDEIVKDYSDRIYREAYTNIEKVLRAELESAKTIYGNIEKTALITVEHVERSWRTLSRIIVIILGVVSVIGSGLAIFGYSTYKDIEQRTQEVRDMRDTSRGYVSDIAQIRESARANKLLREVMLELRQIREDFSLENGLDRMNLEELWTSSRRYTPARTALLNYITTPEQYEPAAVVEATGLLLELQRQGKLPLEPEVYYRMHDALLQIAMENPGDWRQRLRVRDQVIALGTLVQDRKFIEHVVRAWHELLVKADLEPQLREDAAVISGSLGSKVKDIQKDTLHALGETMHDTGKTFWRRYAAAAALITMGDEQGKQGLDYLVSQTHLYNRESFWADIYLGRLGKEKLERLATVPNYGEYVTPQAISKRIVEKLGYVQQNPLLEHYASKLARCLVTSELGCMENAQ
jgi:CRP-like cAMP-binding protein